MRSDDPPRPDDDESHTDTLQLRCVRLESRLNAALSELDSSARQLVTQQTRVSTLERTVSQLRSLLERSRKRERQLLEELSDERRGGLRLLQAAQEERERLENEIRDLRVCLEEVAPGSEPPRHSRIVQRAAAAERNADTVPPPPVNRRTR